MRTEMKVFSAAVVASVVTMLAAVTPETSSAEELNPIQIDEWPTPWQGRGRDPYVASSDEIWFVGQRGHYLARFTPSTEEFFKVDLPAGSGPHNTIVQSNGLVWYSGNAIGEIIGYYDPKTDSLTTIDVPGARDPHTLVFDDNEEHIFFTVQGGNQIGRLTLADHSIELVDVPTERSRPYGIKIAPDGTPWIVLLGTNKLATVDPETMALTEIELPEADARPRRLEITSDGRIWYADFARGTLGMHDPASGRFDEFPLPAGAESRPYGMALDEMDRVWVVETGIQPNQFVGFDTKAHEVFSITEIPSGAGSVRHMDYDEAAGAVWFGTDTEMLGRAQVRTM
ncbi:MAG: lyase, partial [Gammaproteobacteria bacterium]|nr:lyase [Gammaproteobacteria bacterium]